MLFLSRMPRKIVGWAQLSLRSSGRTENAVNTNRKQIEMNIEQLRTFCLSFPGATEDIKWGADLCFCVGAKMFCVTGADSISGGMSIKCTPERFDELIEREGIDPAAYVGRYKWVRISDLKAVTPSELNALIGESYRLVFDKLAPKVKKTIK